MGIPCPELEVEHQTYIQEIEALVGIDASGEVLRHVSETRDRQTWFCHRLEFRMLDHESVEIEVRVTSWVMRRSYESHP
jgi:hypothetical protein